jgi:hypothetical protein
VNCQECRIFAQESSKHIPGFFPVAVSGKKRHTRPARARGIETLVPEHFLWVQIVSRKETAAMEDISKVAWVCFGILVSICVIGLIANYGPKLW